jgi:hypothetical protein
VTSGRRDWASPSLSALCGHPRHCRATSGAVATPRRCWDIWGQDVAATAAVPRVALVNGTLEPLSCDYAGSNHDAGPAVAPSPSLSTPCGHPRHCRATLHTATTTPTLLSTRGRDAATPATAPRTGHCQRPLEPARSRSGQPLRLYPRSCSCSGTGRATTLQLEQDSPGRPSTLRHCSPYRNTYRNSAAHMLTASSLAYKRRGSPQPQGTDTGRRIAVTHTLSAFPTILALASIKPLGLGGHAFSPAPLVATPLRAPWCK